MAIESVNAKWPQSKPCSRTTIQPSRCAWRKTRPREHPAIYRAEPRKSSTRQPRARKFELSGPIHLWIGPNEKML